jgi:hypothetical protein
MERFLIILIHFVAHAFSKRYGPVGMKQHILQYCVPLRYLATFLSYIQLDGSLTTCNCNTYFIIHLIVLTSYYNILILLFL